MASNELAYCGLDCRECSIYVTEFSADGASGAARCGSPCGGAVICPGCRAGGDLKSAAGTECPIMACCRAKGHENCGVCPGMRDCRHFTAFIRDLPEARENLLAWRAAS